MCLCGSNTPSRATGSPFRPATPRSTVLSSAVTIRTSSAARAGLPGGGVQQFRPPPVVPGQLDQHGLEPEIVPARADAGSAARCAPEQLRGVAARILVAGQHVRGQHRCSVGLRGGVGVGSTPNTGDGVGELHHGVLADAAQLTVEDAVLDEARSPLW